MFEQVFKKLDDILWKDDGCDTELDYAEHSSQILFLKWLDDYEKVIKLMNEFENGRNIDSYLKTDIAKSTFKHLN